MAEPKIDLKYANRAGVLYSELRRICGGRISTFNNVRYSQRVARDVCERNNMVLKFRVGLVRGGR